MEEVSMVTVTQYYSGQLTSETFNKGKDWLVENGFLRVFGKNKILAEYSPGTWVRVCYSK